MFSIRIMSILLSLCMFLKGAHELPLPRHLSSKGIRYIETQQIDTLGCGYNALYNAANFEYHCGFSNDAHRYRQFTDKVSACIDKKGFNRLATYTNQLEYLGHNVLHLRPLFHLHKNQTSQKIEFLHHQGLTISHRHGASQGEIDRLFLTAEEKRQKQSISSVKRLLAQHPSAVIHFICVVQSQGTDHAVLISLCQNETGRGLYLFDNLNESVRRSSEVAACLEFLAATFSISSKEQFCGPQLPTRWSSHASQRYTPYFDRFTHDGNMHLQREALASSLLYNFASHRHNRRK